VSDLIADYALVIHRSARIADGAQIWRFGVTGQRARCTSLAAVGASPGADGSRW
jgi:hypothetical protein